MKSPSANRTQNRRKQISGPGNVTILCQYGKRSVTVSIVVMLLGMALSAMPAYAQTCQFSWKSLQPGNWEGAGNWTPMGPPTNGSNVCLENGLNFLTPTITTLDNRSVTLNLFNMRPHLQSAQKTNNNKLIIGSQGSLSVMGGTIQGKVKNRGQFDVAAGGAGVRIRQGPLGAFENQGLIYASGSLTFDGIPVDNRGGRITSLAGGNITFDRAQVSRGTLVSIFGPIVFTGNTVLGIDPKPNKRMSTLLIGSRFSVGNQGSLGVNGNIDLLFGTISVGNGAINVTNNAKLNGIGTISLTNAQNSVIRPLRATNRNTPLEP